MVNAVHMPVSRERMEQYQNRHMKQIEHVARQWDARESKIKNNNLRRQWIERQTNANYRNEYDRLRGELGRGKIPHQTMGALKARQAELERLFSSANL